MTSTAYDMGINKFFKLKRVAHILAYIVLKFDAINNPVQSTHIAEFYKLSPKQVLGYINELDESKLIERPEKTCPRPVKPTEKGREMYYSYISNFFSKKKQRSIQNYIP
jgi:Mn-dependent DtxR family transcriptional regulator